MLPSFSRRALHASVLGLFACSIALAGCGGGGFSGGGGGGTSSSASTGTSSGSCDTDPLKTGLVAQQTGVSADAFDCEILTMTAMFQEPDPMIFKAVMYNESRFDKNAVACPNLPCGTPSGWTTDESGCYGLMQVVPACGGPLVQPCIMADGHPDLEMDSTAADYASSVFNPSINAQIGIGGFHDNRQQVMQMFAGCTEEQYTLMALGNYANYGSTMSCTVYNTDYTNLVLGTYHMYAAAAGYPEHPYP
jgi:hypothetical protein